MKGRGRIIIAQRIIECVDLGSIMAVKAILMQETVFNYSASRKVVRSKCDIVIWHRRDNKRPAS